MSLPTVKKGSSVGRVRIPYSFPQSTLVNYYVSGAGVGAVTTPNRNILRRRAEWRPTRDGKESTRCNGFCDNNNQFRICTDEFCTTSTGFDPTDFDTGSNKIFVEKNLNHHIEILSSGPGQDNSGGFDSLQQPYSESHYASFSATGDQDPATPPLHTAFNPAINGSVSSQGRYLRSKNIQGLKLPAFKSAENKDIHIRSWNELIEMKVVWIAGSGENGADKPDVHEWVGVYPRRSEDFYIEFYDKNNEPVTQEITLWKPKRDPTSIEVQNALAQNVSIYSSIDPQVYGEASEFYDSEALGWNEQGRHWSMYKLDARPFDLTNAEFFIIKQRRHTALLDNYGVKYVELKFKYDCYPN